MESLPLRLASHDHFTALMGASRGRCDAAETVFLVEDLRGFNLGPDSLCVFASHTWLLAEEVADVHRAAGGVGHDVIMVSRASRNEYERICEQQGDAGPGELDRVSSAEEEAAILGLLWEA